jgi:hypothetical protein
MLPQVVYFWRLMQGPSPAGPAHQGSKRQGARDEGGTFVILPDDILLSILDTIPAVKLGQLASTQRRWPTLVSEAAQRRALRQGMAALPIVHARTLQPLAPPTAWLCALGWCEIIEDRVGVRPERGWRTDWEQASRRAGTTDVHTNTLSQPGAIARKLCKFAWALELLELAWPREHAEALPLLHTWANGAIARGVRERSSTYAASTWVLCDALAQQATRQRFQRPVGPVYAKLAGRGGLSTDDPAWNVLLPTACTTGTAADAAVPISKPVWFRTNAVALAASARQGVVWSGQPTGHAAGPGIVQFRQRAMAGGAIRSLVEVGSDRYALPPLACITLESVDEPGEWKLSEEDRGPTLCRRYTVVVDW